MKNSVRKAQKKDVDIIHKLLDMEPFKYNEDVPYDREWIEQLVVNKKCWFFSNKWLIFS